MSHFWNENEAAPGYENVQGKMLHSGLSVPCGVAGQSQSYQPLPSHFTAEPLATFDLTPASGSDGMVFNLTPAPAPAPVPAD